MRYFKKNNKYKYGDRQKDSGMYVTVRQVKNKDGTTTSDVNGALRVLKKKLMKEGLFQELRERSYYTKPSALKREKKNKAILRNKYKVLKEKEQDK